MEGAKSINESDKFLHPLQFNPRVFYRTQNDKYPDLWAMPNHGNGCCHGFSP